MGLVYRRQWRHLYRVVTPHNEYPDYDSKQSNGENSVMLELWGMWSTPSLPSLPGSGSLDRILFMGQIELFDWVHTNYLCYI